MRPMRHTQRRRLINRTLARAEAEATRELAALLDKRKRVLVRELRRANLKKRLYKAERDQRPMEKAIGLDWKQWVSDFTQGIKDVLGNIIRPLQTVEQDYWSSHGREVSPLEAEAVIAAYQERVGRDLGDIAQDTHDNVINEIQTWYNEPDANLPDLLDRLDKYFSPARAEAIVKTDSNGVASQIAYDTMDELGIKHFNVDLGVEVGQWPCQECIDEADANPHEVGDRMPPFHTHCRCGVSYID